MKYKILPVFLLFSIQVSFASQKHQKNFCGPEIHLHAGIMLRRFEFFDQYKFLDGTTIEKYKKGNDAGNVYVALPSNQAVQFKPQFTKIFLHNGTVVEKNILTGIKKITKPDKSFAEYRPDGSIKITLANGSKYMQDNPESALRLLPKKSVSFKEPEKPDRIDSKQLTDKLIHEITQARYENADQAKRAHRGRRLSLYGSIAKK